MATGPQGVAAQPIVVLAKRALPWLVLAGVALFAFRYYGVYKDNMVKYQAGQGSAGTSSATTASPKPSKTTSGSKIATKTPNVPSAPTQVLILKDVNFHKDPNLASDNYRLLKAGERLTLVGQSSGWYRVTDDQGNIGWVMANKTYAKLVAGK
jgi:uncharacterized protein YgiM (DUF1202 family)